MPQRPRQPPAVKSLKNYLIAVLALVVISGATLCWQQYSELVELRAAAMNKSERADLQKRVWELEKLNKQMRDRFASSRPGADDPADRPPPDGAPPPGRPGRGGPGGNPLQQFGALRDVMAKPEVQALISSQQKAVVDSRYAALFKNLNLTPDQSEKLKTILADRQTTMADVMAAARDQGINPRTDPDAFQKLQEVAKNDINNSIKAVIGESGFTQFESYEQTLPQRNVVEQLQRRLSYTDTPLTSQQSEQLVTILATTSPTPTTTTQPGANLGPPGGGRGGPDLAMVGAFLGGGPGGGGGLMAMAGAGGGAPNVNATVPITAAAVNQAQAVLAAPQVAALQQLQQQQQNQQQLAKIVTDAIAAQNAANPRQPTGGGATPKGGKGG